MNDDQMKNILTKLAEEVRDMCRHAAACAPLHRLEPEDAVMGVDVAWFVDVAMEGIDHIALEPQE